MRLIFHGFERAADVLSGEDPGGMFFIPAQGECDQQAAQPVQ